MHIGNHPQCNLIPPINIYDFSDAFILISIPVLFAGITVAWKVINKAMTNQSIYFMQMMADSKKKKKNSNLLKIVLDKSAIPCYNARVAKDSRCESINPAEVR